MDALLVPFLMYLETKVAEKNLAKLRNIASDRGWAFF